jgi:hypothetical protein
MEMQRSALCRQQHPSLLGEFGDAVTNALPQATKQVRQFSLAAKQQPVAGCGIVLLLLVVSCRKFNFPFSSVVNRFRATFDEAGRDPEKRRRVSVRADSSVPVVARGDVCNMTKSHRASISRSVRLR